MAEAQESKAAPGFFQKHGNTILTGVLLVAAVVMLVRWRINSAAAARQGILSRLSEARSTVAQLRTPTLAQMPPAELIKTVQSVQASADGTISDLLNTADDDSVKAQALVIRGDLYWQLANLPELPGATTEPTRRLSDSGQNLINKSADAYQKVVSTPAFAADHDSLSTARLGLAAIAENKNDWVTATSLLTDVKNDAQASTVDVDAAKMQLEIMLRVQSPVYVAPPSGAATQPSTAPSLMYGPALPAGIGPMPLPTTMPGLPSTLPTTLPSAAIMSTPAAPTTRPAVPAMSMPVIPKPAPATQPVAK